MRDKYCVFTFESVGESIMFEKKLKSLGFNIKLIPAPREVSSSCGTAAKIECDKKEILLKLCEDEKLVHDGFFEIN